MMKETFDGAASGDHAELVQRFVDQELSAEERVQLLSRLGRDEVLRRRTIELERLVLDAGRLPRPIVPDAFAAGVLKRLPPVVPTLRPARGWRTFLDALRAPHQLRWNLAGAMVVASVAVLVIGAIVMSSGSKADGGIRPVSSATSAPAATFVRLVITQPGAKTVQIAGDFNGWNPARTPLEQISDGAWAVTIALTPGRYAYMFVVDGKQWIADPFAAEQKDDGFGSRNAVLEVRPAETGPGASL